MPTFLSDPAPGLYLVLIAIVLVTGVVAARNQDRRSLARLGIAAGALGLLYLVDRLFESPREEAVRKVQAMADAATAADPNRFVQFVSPSFQMNGKNREGLKASPAWDLIRAHHARVAVWDFGQDAFKPIGENEIEIGFYAKAEAAGGGMVMRYAKARFVKDPDGQYRVKSIAFYNPADRGLNAEDPIPGFP